VSCPKKRTILSYYKKRKKERKKERKKNITIKNVEYISVSSSSSSSSV